MTPIDDALRRSLSSDDEAFLKDLEEGRGLFTQMGAMFEGPMKLWTYFSFIMSFVMFGLFAVFLWKGIEAGTVRETVLYCTGAVWFAIAVAMMKMWWWMRMNHLATLRELKKIELRVTQIAGSR